MTRTLTAVPVTATEYSGLHVMKVTTFQMYTKYFSKKSGFHAKSGTSNTLQNVKTGPTTLDTTTMLYSWAGPQMD